MQKFQKHVAARPRELTKMKQAGIKMVGYMPIIYQPGRYPPTYADQIRSWGLPIHIIDVYGWSLRQLDKLDISQDDLNLILGGNAARLFGIEMPYTRMFKEYLK
jgi:hypothetical protein